MRKFGIVAFVTMVGCAPLATRPTSASHVFAPPPTPYDPTLDPPKLVVKYDRFKDTSTIGTSAVSIVGSLLTSGLFFESSFPCPGNTQHCRPESVFLAFDSLSSDWTYLKDYHVILLADGKRIVPKSVAHDGKATTAGSAEDEDLRIEILETVAAEVQPDDLHILARATSISAQVGPTEVELPASVLASLKLLDAQIQ